MICPHCNKHIKRGVTPEIRKLIVTLSKQGFSVRDIEKVLFKEYGALVSFSQVAKILRDNPKER